MLRGKKPFAWLKKSTSPEAIFRLPAPSHGAPGPHRTRRCLFSGQGDLTNRPGWWIKSSGMQRALSPVGQALILALIMGYVCMLAMASSPSLHHWLHGDSDEPDHHCAVTALLDGQFNRSTVPPVAVVQPALQAESATLLRYAHEPCAVLRSAVRGRAPPSA